MTLRNRILALVLTCTVALPGRPLAQTTAPDSTGGGTESLFETSDLYWAAGFVGATVILAPLDRALARALQDSVLQANRLLEVSATSVRLLASPGGFVLG